MLDAVKIRKLGNLKKSRKSNLPSTKDKKEKGNKERRRRNKKLRGRNEKERERERWRRWSVKLKNKRRNEGTQQKTQTKKKGRGGEGKDASRGFRAKSRPFLRALIDASSSEERWKRETKRVRCCSTSRIIYSKGGRRFSRLRAKSLCITAGFSLSLPPSLSPLQFEFYLSMCAIK